MPGATLREATCAGSGPGAHPSPRAPTRPRYPIWSCPHHGSSPVRGPALVTARDRRPRGTLTCPRADVPTTALRSLDPNSHEDDLRTSQLPSGTRPPDAAGPRPHPPRGALHLQAPPRVARALPPRRRLRPVRLPPLGAVGARGRLTPAGSPVRPFRVVRRSRHVYAGPVDSPSGPRAAGSRALVVGAGVGGPRRHCRWTARAGRSWSVSVHRPAAPAATSSGSHLPGSTPRRGSGWTGSCTPGSRPTASSPGSTVGAGPCPAWTPRCPTTG